MVCQIVNLGNKEKTQKIKVCFSMYFPYLIFLGKDITVKLSDEGRLEEWKIEGMRFKEYEREMKK